MSVDTVTTSRCPCGVSIYASTTMTSTGWDFFCCRACGAIDDASGRCVRCARALEPWDERSCPVCRRQVELTWVSVFD